jgi:uncharacterized phage protein (TIGR02220 family)
MVKILLSIFWWFKMRQSFILHIDSLCVLEDLTNEQRGELFNAIYCYQVGEEITLTPIVKIAFSQFKNQFIRDEEKYKKTVEARKQAGSMGGKQRVANQANASKSKQNIANQADSDSKNKNKSDSKSVSDSNYKYTIVEIIFHLNSILKTNYKSSSQKTSSLIKARLSDGFTLDDFKQVHMIKYAEWNGTDMQKFLRPETLYGNKFESYLNQKLTLNEKYKAVSNHTGMSALEMLKQQGYAE